MLCGDVAEVFDTDIGAAPLAAVTDAFSHNFRVVVVEEAVGDRSPSAHMASLFDMDMKFADVESHADVRSELEQRFGAASRAAQ